MPFFPISGTIPQYDKEAVAGSGPAADYVIKFYDTSNVAIPMFSDSSGGGSLASALLDSSGYPINGSSLRFTPFIDQEYKIAFFSTQALADANDFNASDWFIGPYPVVADDNTFPTLAAAVASDSIEDGDLLHLVERATGKGGGAFWVVVLSSTVTENTYNIVQGTGVATLSLVLIIEERVYAKAFGVVVTDNKAALQALIDFAIANSKIIDGENDTYALIGRITIPADCIIENLHLDFDDSDSTNFQLWFGNSTLDAPAAGSPHFSINSGYTGENIHVRNMNVKPSKTCLKPVRLRGMFGSSFANFNVTPAEFQDAPNGAIYVHIDGMLNTKFTQCHWSPNTEGATVTTAPVTNNFQISQMFNLAFSASAGNGVTSTSSSLSNCKFRRSSRIGDVSGDDIIFNEACIFESALEGVTIIEDQSFVTFEDAYWENIDRFKIHARGVDVANPGTRVVVRGGKVQCNEDNGSAPDHAFMKVENTYSATIEKTVFQGRAQTRLIEIVVGGGTRSDCLVYQDVNVGAKTRNSSSDTIASKTLTITNTDATLSIESTDHDLLDGDIVDIIASDQSDPYLGVNQLLPSLVVTKTDDDNFTVESDLTASSSGTSVVTYRKYRDSTNCLANMDEPSQNVVERGDHQVRGQNAYNFNDTWTEFVTFSFLAASSATADTMLTNGVASYISNDTAYLKSIKYIDLSDTAPTTRFVDVFYGGNEFTQSLVKRVANSGTDRESTLQYIAPFKLHPYEPLTCVVTTAGSGNIFPRTLTCILEISHTGLTYDNDTPK